MLRSYLRPRGTLGAPACRPAPCLASLAPSPPAPSGSASPPPAPRPRALLRASDAASPHPAARGLDIFVHAPTEVAPGGSLPIAVEAVGFTSVVTPVRLAHAVIEAAWNPESLGKVFRAPPAVKVTTDGEGRAHLDVPMPDGDEGD